MHVGFQATVEHGKEDQHEKEVSKIVVKNQDEIVLDFDFDDNEEEPKEDIQKDTKEESSKEDSKEPKEELKVIPKRRFGA